jgi:hypothetical protein
MLTETQVRKSYRPPTLPLISYNPAPLEIMLVRLYLLILQVPVLLMLSL